MKVTVTKALTNYFNVGDGKRVTRDWAGELKDPKWGPTEKWDLALQVCAVTGDELVEA
jgi:hypothetical protein